MVDNRLGEFIKYRRNIQKVALRTLAETAEVSPSQLSKIERGLSIPTRETLLKLAYAMNVDKDELLALGGYVSSDSIEDVTYLISKAQYGYDEVAVSAETAGTSYAVPKVVHSIEDAIKQILIETKQAEGMSDIFLDYIVREMIAAYDITLKKSKKR